jgi:alpha-L-fucosidase 2
MKRLLALILLCATGLAGRAALTNNIEYGKTDGESLRLDAFVPDGPGPFAAVILVHGGGWDSGDKAGGAKRSLIAPMEDPLGNAGFAWFSINYRLAPKHPYPACIDDLETAIRWVKAHAAEYHLDPSRLAIAGESAGAHMVELAAVRADQSTRVAAVVSFYGRADLLADIRNKNGKLTGAMAQLFGTTVMTDATRDVLRSASPLYHVQPGLPPFLLLHGDKDTQVPYEESLKMRAKLWAAGDRCDLITIPNGPHGMFYWERYDPAYKSKVIAWLQHTLPPHPWRYRMRRWLGI